MFKKGDKVYCAAFGMGVVTKVGRNPRDEYSIYVEFKRTEDWYTKDGRFYDGHDQEYDIQHATKLQVLLSEVEDG